MTRKRKKKKASTVRPVNYRRKALDELSAKYPHYILKSNILGGLFFAGSILTIWEIFIYRMTFISVCIPLSVWILTGLIITPIFKTVFNIYCFNPRTPGRTPILFHYLYNIVSFGGILVFLFMWTNQAFNDESKTVITLPIISSGHLAKSRRSCGEPYACVIYKHLEKDLIFPCGIEIEKFSSVSIEVSRGLYGFDVISNKTLIEEQW